MKKDDIKNVINQSLENNYDGKYFSIFRYGDKIVFEIAHEENREKHTIDLEDDNYVEDFWKIINDEIIADRDHFTALTYDEGVRVFGPHFRFLIEGDSKRIVVDFGSDNGNDMLLLKQIYEESKVKDNNGSHKIL